MMMRKTVMLLGALGALGLGMGCAGTKEAGKDVSAAIPGVYQHRDGVITQVHGNNIAVADANNLNEPVAWFNINANTKIERDGKRVELSQLSEGTAVRVSFEPATGAEKTSKIEVLSGDQAQQLEQKLQGHHETTPPPPPQNP
ncbi:hypothetical protein JY651_00985 [Pyxidicoccus parkwayensis]|uniref:Lipoprotein n=1 Tax=Pyxidicoccus parkwayensis TaxID=2813578 RepID=A0ABX7NXG9_9BACT|nr:hypothetical protein [Pyxidicoccus parkwaysis]QSQ23592.1 hypothetical protein JY651_00985 [Pyxidicoccus parkwaysis]